MHSPIPGSELTKEPFRWDQRLFSLVLRLSGTPAVERDIGMVASDASPIDAMCEVTGGKCHRWPSLMKYRFCDFAVADPIRK
jgi:integrator complex subunit 6